MSQWTLYERVDEPQTPGTGQVVIWVGVDGIIRAKDDTGAVTILGQVPGEVNTGANVGTGTGLVFRDKTGATLNFKTIKAGANIGVVNNADDVTVSAPNPGEVNTASNTSVVGGASVFKVKTVADLVFRQLKAGSARITVTQNTDDITIDVPVLNVYSIPGTEQTKLSAGGNWTGVNYTGPAITGTFQGQRYFDATYVYEAVADNVWVRVARA